LWWQFVVKDGVRFCLGRPVDTPMVIINSADEPLEYDAPIMEEIFPQVDDAMATEGYLMDYSAGFITIKV